MRQTWNGRGMFKGMWNRLRLDAILDLPFAIEGNDFPLTRCLWVQFSCKAWNSQGGSPSENGCEFSPRGLELFQAFPSRLSAALFVLMQYKLACPTFLHH